jgi:hypothetical protein
VIDQNASTGGFGDQSAPGGLAALGVAALTTIGLAAVAGRGLQAGPATNDTEVPVKSAARFARQLRRTSSSPPQLT